MLILHFCTVPSKHIMVAEWLGLWAVHYSAYWICLACRFTPRHEL